MSFIFKTIILTSIQQELDQAFARENKLRLLRGAQQDRKDIIQISLYVATNL